MRMFCGFLLALVGCCFLLETAGAQAVDLQVRLVYFKNGKPAARQPVILYEGDPARISTPKLTATTSADGVATFQLTNPLPNTVWTNEENGRIRGCASEKQLPLDLVIKQGVTIGVDARFGSSCKGDRSLLTRLAAKPGEVVIFVRKVTPWDNLREY
jgi:hypothetical protein